MNALDKIVYYLRSTNGTYINQYMLGKGNSMKLKTGDIVAFVEKDGYGTLCYPSLLFSQLNFSVGTFSYVFYDVCAPPSTSVRTLFTVLVLFFLSIPIS
jgi:hypothetical protein